MFITMNYTQAILLLLSNPVMGWVTWYGSTPRDVAAPVTAPPTYQLPENMTAVAELPNAGGAIDMLRLLNLSASTPGVAQVPGPILNVPAFKLRPGFGQVQVPNPGAVTAALTSSAGFTLVFVYRQHRKSLGTLVSVHSPGRVTPSFQLASNLRTGQLLLHYKITTDAKLHQNTWSLRAGAQAAHHVRTNSIAIPDRMRKGGGLGWTFVSLSLNTTTNTLRLQLDCQPAREQPLAGSRGAARPMLQVPEDALVYFRQEPGFKKKFLGSMQVAKVYPFATSQVTDWACHDFQLVRQAH